LNSVRRWRAGRTTYRPAGELIKTADYDVALLPRDTEATQFILEHHDSPSYPAARWRFGLFRAAQLVGTAVFSHPSNNAVLTNVFPANAPDSVEPGPGQRHRMADRLR
jgi:hypothetical protein